MSAAERWLRARAGSAPVTLLDVMTTAIPADEASVPEALARGAHRLYQAVVGGEGGREDALPLLAADALLTHAFEAQAELDPGGIEALAARWGGRGVLGEVSA